VIRRQELLPPGVADETLSAHLRVVRTQGWLTCETEDATVLFRSEDGSVRELDPFESRIWKHIGEPETVGKVVNLMLDECGLDRPSCEARVFASLAEMSDGKLVVFCL